MPRARGVWVTVWSTLLVGVCGCASARYVAVDAGGGVVAIPHNTNSWPSYYRNSAEDLMRQKCPEGYVIDHEGEAAVGQTVTEQTAGNDASLMHAVFGVGASSRTTVTRDIKEWHIQFHAKGAPAPTPTPAPRASLPAEPEPIRPQ